MDFMVSLMDNPDMAPEKNSWKKGHGQSHVTVWIFGHYMLIAQKWLKIRTSSLTRVLTGKVPTWSLKKIL